MPLTITQSNKKEYIGKDFIFNNGKDKIIIGLKIFGIGKNFEIPCKDVNEFKLLDENSKPFISSNCSLDLLFLSIYSLFLIGFLLCFCWSSY